MPSFVGCVFLSASYWLPVASLDILLARLNIYSCCGLETGECCECGVWWLAWPWQWKCPKAGRASWLTVETGEELALSGWAHLSWLKCRQHTAYNEIVKYWQYCNDMTFLFSTLRRVYFVRMHIWRTADTDIENALYRFCVSCFSILFRYLWDKYEIINMCDLFRQQPQQQY